MIDTLEEIRKQHIENYKKAILENIKNNTSVLVDDEIMSLLNKPPLDSMDIVRVKFLELAKKNKLVLNTDSLDSLLENYRKDIIKCCKEIKEVRIADLSSKLDSITFEKENDIIKINKKDFAGINKKIKKIVKDKIKDSVTKKIVNNVNKLFTEEKESEKDIKIKTEIEKFMLGTYQRQLLESIDIKVLVKDTTLVNSVKEQAERYLFTLSNSRLFKSNKGE